MWIDLSKALVIYRVNISVRFRVYRARAAMEKNVKANARVLQIFSHLLKVSVFTSHYSKHFYFF